MGKLTLYDENAKVLGHKNISHRDWFDENDREIQSLLEDKNCLHQKVLSATGTSRKSLLLLLKQKKYHLQRRLKQMKNSWWINLSRDIQSAFDTNDSKNMYASVKQTLALVSLLYHRSYLKINQPSARIQLKF